MIWKNRHLKLILSVEIGIETTIIVEELFYFLWTWTQRRYLSSNLLIDEALFVSRHLPL